MSVSSLSASSSRLSKQPRLDSFPISSSLENFLFTAIQLHVAGFLPFKEAMYFLGKKGSFVQWQKAKKGIDISDWLARKGNADQQKKWDDKIFPQICKQIQKVANESWVENLRIAHLSDKQLTAFSSIQFPHLKCLRLQLSSSEANHSPERRAAIAQLISNSSDLTHVTIGRFTDDETLLLVQKCSNLTSLKIENMMQWRHQEHFGIRQSWKWEPIATELANRYSFQNLCLGDGCDLSGEQVFQIAQIPQLRNITVASQVVRDTTFEAFAGHPGLEEARLVDLKQITDRTMKTFSGLPSLTSMEISSCPKVTPDGVLMGAQKLSCLVLGQFEMTSSLLKSLSYFPSLTSLRLLECTAIGDGDLQELGSRSKLRELEILRGNKAIACTDAGLTGLASPSLEHLKLRNPLRQEKIVSVFANQTAWKNITPEGVKELIKKSPNLCILDIPRFPKGSTQGLKRDLLTIQPHLKLSFAGERA